MQKKRISFYFWSTFILITVLLSSCMMNNYVYIHEKQKQGLADTMVYYVKYEKYRLQADDILYIKIKSTNPQLNEIFSQQNPEQENNSSGGEYPEDGSRLDKDGVVVLPLVGKFNLLNKTIEEAEDTIQYETNKKFNDAIVVVRLLDFRVVFMGEVGQIGTAVYHREKVNLLEALANSGGITSHGNMRKVWIIRATKRGSKTFLIDVSDRSLLSNKEFYLRPNDIVYVEPRKTKPLQQLVNDYGTVLGVFSTILTTITLLYTLAGK